jgi:hypothetical protein
LKKLRIIGVCLAGALVGVFWLIAIDAGVNGASWPPNWHRWTSYLTCPFIPLVGLNNFANVLVPVLNGAYYVFVALCISRFVRKTDAKKVDED